MPTDPTDVDFVDDLKRLLGIDAKAVKALLPKLDADVLADLAAAVTNGKKQDALKLIKAGRVQAMSEEAVSDKAISEDRGGTKPMMRKKKSEESAESETGSSQFNVGDPVKIRSGAEATIKISKGPGNTVGVMIDGKLEMINRNDITKIDEAVFGMNTIPALRRMQELAGIAQGAPVPFETDDEPADEAATVIDIPSEEVEVPTVAGTDTDCGATAVALLDKLLAMLPNLRLSDIKAVRKRMNDITLSLNETAGANGKVVETRRRRD